MMGLTALKAENLKPVILKAGVPLAASLAGLIYAWIVAKKNLSTKLFSSPENEESFHNLSSNIEDEGSSLVIHDNNNNSCLEQEITGLRSQIKGLQMREVALYLQFELYCEMKEQESLLLDVKNMLSLENDRAEFLSKEVYSIETETMRLESFVVQYMSVIEELQYWKSQNRVLQRRVQRLLRDTKAKSRLIKAQAMKIKEKEAEILRYHDALETRVSVINKLEGELMELQGILDQLKDEKNEVVKKLETAEAYASKLDKEKIHRKPLKYYLEVESRDVSKEDYNKVLNELEEVKKERANEVEELIHLRRLNAWLREELMRHYEEQHDDEQDRDHEFEGGLGVLKYDSEHEVHHSLLENHHNGSAHHASSSKRRKLLKRLKRWVEGSEKVRVKPEMKCLDIHSGSYGSKKPQVPPSARFCSSA